MTFVAGYVSKRPQYATAENRERIVSFAISDTGILVGTGMPRIAVPVRRRLVWLPQQECIAVSLSSMCRIGQQIGAEWSGSEVSMRLLFRRIATLPRLAWCAVLVERQDTIEVFHGPMVETAEDFFCEGAWSGPFVSHQLDTTILMGSGGRLVRNALLVAAPSHTLERLFLLRNRKTLVVSNSFAFALACAGDNVNPRSLLYSVRLASIVDGLRSYARSLRTLNGNRLQLYYHCNLLIDSELRVAEQPKQPVRDFVSFADYKSFLLHEVSAIHANANDPHRKIRYRPIATVSAGYDSPAAAVLARAVGCTEALTFSGARASTVGDDTNDSGEAIAAKLGLKAHVFDRLDYLRETNFPEAEFFGWGAQEAPWASHLEGRLVFTGFHGDKVWDRNCKKVGPHIVRGDPSGHNMNAFRLRVGWIHVPVPFVGCTSHRSIHRISNSPEMDAWSTRNQYDRPIPRRLVEEAGVERSQFGMKKRAVSLGLDSEGLKERMTPESYEDYVKYYAKHWNGWMTVKRWMLTFLRKLYRWNTLLNTRLTALLEYRAGLHVELPVIIPRDFRISRYGDLDHLSLLVHWSIEKIRPQYVLDQQQSER